MQRVRDWARRSAEQWVIECPTCGHAEPALERGIVRVAAASRGKRIGGRCAACGRLVMLKLLKDPARAAALRSAAASQSPEPGSIV